MAFSFELAVFGSTIAVLFAMAFLLYYFAVDYKRNLLGESASSLSKEESNLLLSKMRREISFSAFFLDDSKSIGIRYLITAIILFFVGGLAGIGMRISLWFPNPSFLTPTQYNILLTAHGDIMLYGFAVGSILALGYYLLPSANLIVRDTLGTVKSIMYWFFLIGSLFIIFSRSTATWYNYYPLVDQLTTAGGGQYSYFELIGLTLILLSTTVSSIIFLKMIFIDRNGSIPFSKISMFSWSIVTAAVLVLASAPISMIANGYLIYDLINPIFFQGSNLLTDPILFWFWGHPLVYIAILPAFGLIYELLPKYAGVPLFSYRAGVFSLLLLMVFSGLVWGHHLFNSGLGSVWDLIFSSTSFIVVIPSALSVFNWIATLWTARRIKLTVPMMFVLNGIIDFIIGGIVGVYSADVGLNAFIHGTYAITSHFHWIFIGLTAGMAFCAIYVLFPTLTGGRTYNVPMAKVHFYLNSVGTILMSGFWLVGGFAGMPRRVAGYFGIFQTYQDAAAIGGVILGIGFLVFLINFAYSAYQSPVTSNDNPIEGEVQVT